MQIRKTLQIRGLPSNKKGPGLRLEAADKRHPVNKRGPGLKLEPADKRAPS